jgi:hypothetical protein
MTDERAARIKRIVRELAAAMAVYPKLNAKQQANLKLGCNLLLARLDRADRVKALAHEARAILNAIPDRDDWPHADLVRLLMQRGFSDPEARTVLDYIDWEDNRFDGESD